MRCPILLHGIAPLAVLVAAGSWLPRTLEPVQPSGRFFTDRGEALTAALSLGRSQDILLYQNDDGTYELRDNPKIVPHLDIKPTSCPNPINLSPNSTAADEIEPGFAVARVPASILGNAFDVTTVDTGSIRFLSPDSSLGRAAAILPIQINFTDTGTPFHGEGCGCHALGGDGELDIDLKFDKAELIEVFGLAGFADGEFVPLLIVGTARGNRDLFVAHDCIKILNH